jgi:hypothetical protein
MLREFLVQLCKELVGSTLPNLSDKKTYPFRLGNDLLSLKDLEPGVAMQAQICPCPEKKKEDLFIYLMRANLLGQGTGNARIGLDAQEKFLTLSLGLPYEMNYQMFKDSLEEFVNYLLFLRDSVMNFENEESIY